MRPRNKKRSIVSFVVVDERPRLLADGQRPRLFGEFVLEAASLVKRIAELKPVSIDLG